MRVRVGNPFQDQHFLVNPAWSMHIYEFITWPDRPPHEVAQAVEWALDNNDHKFAVFGRGTKLEERIYDRTRVNTSVPPIHKDFGTHWFGAIADMQDGDPDKQGWVNGVVWTSWHQEETEHEPCLYVAIGIYDQGCTNYTNCIAGHRGMLVQQGPQLNMGQMLAIEEEVGVHNKYYLGIDPQRDVDILSNLGFTPIDAPCNDSRLYTLEHLYKALDYVALSEPTGFASRVNMLRNAGYILDSDVVDRIAHKRKVAT